MDLEHLDIIPKKVENLFIFLHGYGLNKESGMRVASNFLDLLPNTAFLSLEAPFSCEIGQGFQWFSILGGVDSIYREMSDVNLILDAFIVGQLKRFNLDRDRLIVSGFSQGAIMALFNGLRCQKEYMCLLLFSAMILDNFNILKDELQSKPKIFLANGDMDQFIPINLYKKTEYILEECGIPVESHIIVGKDHSINYECIKLARTFLRNILNKPDHYPRPENYEEINKICVSNIENFINKINR